MNTLTSQKANCKNCYLCLRVCPVKAIRFAGGQAEILPEECIYCGACVDACPQGAKQVESAADRVRAMLSEERVVASLAPSFVGGFPFDPLLLVPALKALGFAEVRETSEGAAVVSDEMARLAGEGKRDIMLTTCCPAVTNLFEKHYPELVDCLAPVATPMTVHARMLKEENPENKVVFIGPCVAKIEEAKDVRANGADAVLTFKEAARMIEEAGIDLTSLTPAQPDGKGGGLARIYPTTSGILENLRARGDFGYHLIHAEGMDECYQIICAIREGSLSHAIVEMSSCPGSCLGGPQLARPLSQRFKGRIDVLAHADHAPEPVPAFETKVNLRFPYTDRKKAHPVPTEEELTAILRSIGKETKLDELNCTSCGYDSCRAKAEAVFQGKAEAEMCLPYLLESAQSMANVILDNTPNMILVADSDYKLVELNHAAQQFLGLSRSQGLTHYIYEFFEISDFEYVLSTGKSITDKKVTLSDGSVAVETLTYLPKRQSVMAVLRDVTAEEEKERQLYKLRVDTMEMAQKVISRQMVAAQEIASLLGETTAETKSTLTKLKDMILSGDEAAE